MERAGTDAQRLTGAKTNKMRKAISQYRDNSSWKVFCFLGELKKRSLYLAELNCLGPDVLYIEYRLQGTTGCFEQNKEFLLPTYLKNLYVFTKSKCVEDITL